MSNDIDVSEVTHRVLVQRILQLEGNLRFINNRLDASEDITGLRLLGGMRQCGAIPLFVGPDFSKYESSMQQRFGEHATELIGITRDLTASPLSSDLKDKVRSACQEGW